MTSKYGLDLTALWGENFKNKFDPHTRNIRTGQINRTHHCKVCEAAPFRRCYTWQHLAFCLVEFTDKDGVTRICGERFAVTSPGGCGQHPYHAGGEVNRIFQTSMRGKELSNFPIAENDDDCNELADCVGELNIQPKENDLQPWQKQPDGKVYRDKPQNLPKDKGKKTKKLPLAMTLKMATRKTRK